jgi:2-methylcitrate dehydratase PrpD
VESRNQDKKIAEVLAEFIVSQKFEDLPEEAIEKVKHYIIDVIGCIVGASKEQQAQVLIEVMKAGGGSPHSSVFANGFKTSVMNAAMINGTMGHIFDFDDDHREATTHTSVAVFPAVFALGEKLKVSGKDLIRAFILGMEVTIRVAESLLGKTSYQGFHPTGTCGVFGAAAGCASLLGLDVKQTKYALGLAGSFAAGTMESTAEGAWAKPLQAGHPAMSGVLAASLAEKNFIGTGTIFDGSMGIIRAFSFKDQYDYDRITENLGEKWEMMDTSIKVHACCRFSASVVDCALDLYRQGMRAKDVKGIVAKVSDYPIKRLCYPIERKYRPVTHVDAQFSLPYAIAVAICKNRTGVDEFRKEVLGDPEVLRLTEKVTWELDPKAEALYPKAYPATLVATLNDGRKFEAHVDYPKGDPENPVSMEEIVNKFILLTEKFFDQKRREKIVEELKRFEEIDNVAKIADLLR